MLPSETSGGCLFSWPFCWWKSFEIGAQFHLGFKLGARNDHAAVCRRFSAPMATPSDAGLSPRLSRGFQNMGFGRWFSGHFPLIFCTSWYILVHSYSCCFASAFLQVFLRPWQGLTEVPIDTSCARSHVNQGKFAHELNNSLPTRVGDPDPDAATWGLCMHSWNTVIWPDGLFTSQTGKEMMQSLQLCEVHQE